jgi:hypothetical protein
MNGKTRIYTNRPQAGLPIWIDGCCVNQSDTAEKSWQVQQMKEVYVNAEITAVFLGPRSDHSDAAIDLLRKTGQEAIEHKCLDGGTDYESTHWARAEDFVTRLLNDDLRNSTHEIIHPATRLLHSILSPSINHDYMPVHLVSAIMDRPWWSRIFVIQELLLSPNPVFICGQRRIHADVLVASLNLYTLLKTVWAQLTNISRQSHDPCIATTTL